MATWLKVVIGLGTVVFAYVAFDGTREYGIVWQLIGLVIGGVIGFVGAIVAVAHVFGNGAGDD